MITAKDLADAIAALQIAGGLLRTPPSMADYQANLECSDRCREIRVRLECELVRLEVKVTE